MVRFQFPSIQFLFVLFIFIPLTVTYAQGSGFSESFDDATLPGWDHSEGVVVVDGVLRIEPGNFVTRPGEWDDYTLTTRVRGIGNGALVIGFRSGPQGVYHLSMEAQGLVLQREAKGQVSAVASADIVFESETWYQLGIEVRAGEIRVSLSDSIVLEYTDPEPIPSGGMGFETLGDMSAEIDQVSLMPLEVGETQGTDTTSEVAPSTESTQPSTTDQQNLTWIRTGGPPGGTGYDIRYSFDDYSTWYVTDAQGGVHISTDNGITWQASNTGIPGQSGPTSDAIGVFCLTVDPHNPQIVWAGTIGTGHVYRSIDGGRTWEERDDGIMKKYDQLSFRGITIDPRSSDIVYAMAETTSEEFGGPITWKSGTGGIIYKTTDAGANWNVIWEGAMPSSLARYMWIDPRNPDVLYVSTGIFDRGAVGDGESPDDPFGGLGILKSTDGGQTWRILNQENGLRHLYIGSLFMHPENPDILLAAAGHLIEPDTISYIERLQNEDQPSPMGIYRTTDGGENWTQTLSGFEVFSSVEICPSNSDIVYAGSPESIYRSEDSGLTWSTISSPWGPPGISVGFPIDMQCDPLDPDRIFVNNYGGGNFLSDDGGLTWKQASQGYTGEQVFSVSIDPYHPARVYAAGFGGLWRSDDSGSTWVGIQQRVDDMTVSGQTISADPSNSNHVLTAKHEIFESMDGGENWTMRWSMEQLRNQGISDESLFPATPVIVFAPSDSSTVYIGFGHENCLLYHEGNCDDTRIGILVSHDGGESWQQITDEQVKINNVLGLEVDPNDANLVYAATETGLFKSLDGGKNWTELSGLQVNTPIQSVAINHANTQYILVSVDRDGIYLSEDGGAIWQHSSAGLEPNGSIHDIVFDPIDPQVVYASDYYSGVYRSMDGGSIWTKINNGVRSRAVRALAISSDGKHLYVGTNEDGVLRLDLNGQPP